MSVPVTRSCFIFGHCVMLRCAPNLVNYNTDKLYINQLMKTERKSNKIVYIYFIVILGYIVGQKNQMPQGFIIVHPYFKQHMDDVFLLCV